MTRSCKIGIYYRLNIYSDIKDVSFGQKAGARETKRWCWHLQSEIIWPGFGMAKLNVVHKWVEMGRIQSFIC